MAAPVVLRRPQPLGGTIERLELTNFMCHANLTLDFNRKINFIIGKNGSGKSAIMAALMVVLGSKALDTSRGRNLASFVKNGANMARVRVTLMNRGSVTKHPDIYGTTIILSRTISRKGQTKIYIHKVNSGEIPIHRNELDQLLNGLHLNLPNPFALMTQETMKTFLSNGKPHEMYELLLEGTGIKEAIDIHQKLKDKLDKFTEDKDEMEREQEELRLHILELEEKLKTYETYKESKRQLAQLDKDMIWCKVLEEELLLDRLQKDIARLQAMRVEQLQQLTDVEAEVEGMQAKLDEHQETIDSVKSREASFRTDKQQLKNELAMRVSERDEVRAQLNTKERKLTVTRAEGKALREGFSKLSKVSVAEEMERRKGQQELVTRLQSELDALVESREAFIAEIAKVREQHSINMELVTEKKETFAILKKRTAKETADFEQAKKQSGNCIPNIYGSKMADLLREIDKAHLQKKFSKKPFGPIGLYVKVKDPVWALAVEVCLKSELRIFYCNTNEDLALLNKLALKIMPNFPPTTVCSKFESKPFNTSKYRAQPVPGLYSLLDVLTIKETEVLNYLIDQKTIEQVLLCHHKDYKMALELMGDPKTVPKRCIMVITTQGDQIHPHPLVRYYTSEQSQVKFLVKSREDGLQRTEAELQERTQELRRMEAEISLLCGEAKTDGHKLTHLQSRLKKSEEREMMLRRQIESSRQEETDFNHDSFGVLQTQVEENEEKVRQLEEEKRGLEEKFSKSNERVVQTERKMRELNASYKELKVERDNAEDDHRLLKGQIDSEEAKVDFLRTKLDALESKISDVERKSYAQAKKVAAAESKASRTCPRIELDPSTTTQLLQDRKKSLQAYLSSVETNIKINDNFEIMLEEKRSTYWSREKNIKLIEHSHEEMTQALHSRKAHYNNKIILIFLQISEFFRLLFNSQPFVGDLIFNHLQKQMEIELYNKGANGFVDEDNPIIMTNPSGGERTFTTIALILSVWARMRFPFYMLDEFDVFMDVVNRRQCSDLMVQIARDRINNQFIFLTPQSMNIQAEGDITIHRLEDPRPSRQDDSS